VATSNAASSSAQKKAAKKKAKEKSHGKSTWKLIGTASGLIAGIATTKALDATWRTATGRKPPTRPDNPEIASREALLWAAISGMAMTVAKTYATRRAAIYWVKSFGELPPGMAEKATKAQEKKMKDQAASH
jgi:hypothetical protein